MTILVFLGVLSCAIKVQVSGVKREVRDSEDKAGVAKTDIKEKRKVYVHGESWNSEIMAGDRVTLTGCFFTGCFAIATGCYAILPGCFLPGCFAIASAIALVTVVRGWL